MNSLDPFAMNWNQLFVDAVKHRITPANPDDEKSICINRDTFDQLVAVLEIASKARQAIPQNADLLITGHSDSVEAKLSTEATGPVSAAAPSVLQVLIDLRINYDNAVSRLIE